MKVSVPLYWCVWHKEILTIINIAKWKVKCFMYMCVHPCIELFLLMDDQCTYSDIDWYNVFILMLTDNHYCFSNYILILDY